MKYRRVSIKDHGEGWIFFYYHELTLFPAWISNHMPNKVWDEITYPFPNFNGCSVEVWEWIINFIPHLIMGVITYPCSIKLIGWSILVKGRLGCKLSTFSIIQKNYIRHKGSKFIRYDILLKKIIYIHVRTLVTPYIFHWLRVRLLFGDKTSFKCKLACKKNFNSLVPGKFAWNVRHVIFKPILWLMVEASHVKLPLYECHRTSLMISQHWFR